MRLGTQILPDTSPKVTRPASYHPEGHLARRDSLWIPSQHTLDARFTRWCPKSHWGTSVLCGRSGTPRGYYGCTRAYVFSPATHVGALLTRRVRSGAGRKKAVKSDPGGTTQRIVSFEEPLAGSGSGLTALIARCSTPHNSDFSPSKCDVSTTSSQSGHKFSAQRTSNTRLHLAQYPCRANSSLCIRVLPLP